MEEYVILLLSFTSTFSVLSCRKVLIEIVFGQQHLLLEFVEVYERKKVIDHVNMNFFILRHFIFEPDIEVLQLLIRVSAFEL